MREMKMLVQNDETGKVEVVIDKMREDEYQNYIKKFYRYVKQDGYINKAPEKLYHVTTKENYNNILKNGLKFGFDMCIYLCEFKDIESVKNIISLYNPDDEIEIIEIESIDLRKSKLYKNPDKTRGYIYLEEIQQSEIKSFSW